MNYASPREMFADHARLFDENPLANRYRTLTPVDVLVLADELDVQVMQAAPSGGFVAVRKGDAATSAPVSSTAVAAAASYLDDLDLPVAPPQVRECYFVSDWLARALLRQGEIVEPLEAHPGWYVWGRCANDDTPYLDTVIENAFGTLSCAVA